MNGYIITRVTVYWGSFRSTKTFATIQEAKQFVDTLVSNGWAKEFISVDINGYFE